MRLVWTLLALAVVLLIASCFPPTESMAWVPLIAGSLFCSGLAAFLALLHTVGIPTHRKRK